MFVVSSFYRMVHLYILFMVMSPENVLARTPSTSFELHINNCSSNKEAGRAGLPELFCLLSAAPPGYAHGGGQCERGGKWISSESCEGLQSPDAFRLPGAANSAKLTGEDITLLAIYIVCALIKKDTFQTCNRVCCRGDLILLQPLPSKLIIIKVCDLGL